VEFTHNRGDTYEITGVDRDGKRFKRVTDNPRVALSINLWRGSVWHKRPDQARKLIKRVFN